MAALAREFHGHQGFTARAAAGELTAEVFADLDAAAALWRRIESDPACRGTPYQRLDWVEAHSAAFAEAEGFTPKVVVLRDEAGRPRLLLPLAVRREATCRVAHFVGGRHANFHMPLMLEPRGLDPAVIRGALAAAGRAMGLDLFAFSLQPAEWDGAPNPLADGGLPSASDAYGMVLDGDPDATVKRVFGSDARKKLRQKERKLVEALGPVEHRRAASAAEVEAALGAFHTFKAARFAAQGIPNPFAAASARDFLRRVCLTGLAEGRPAAELHTLVAARDERVLAVYVGAVDARRFSGMVTAFDADPEIARGSPGDQLLMRLVRDQAARGRTALDLGAGEARYKANTCDTVIPLFESFVPVTSRGGLLAGLHRLEALARRRIKRTPWAMALARRLLRD